MKPKNKKGWRVSIVIENDNYDEISVSADLPVPFTDEMAKEVMECVKKLVK